MGVPLGELAQLIGCDLDPIHAGPPITGLTLDSRAVTGGDLFAALPGHQRHGIDFAAAAISAGAVAVLTDPAGARQLIAPTVPVLIVDDPRVVLGVLAQHLHGHPARQMRMLGITGTNGKTTIAHLLEAGLRRAGLRTGVIGTVGTRIADRTLPASRTTPEAPDLAELLAQMIEARTQAVAMEVSSHAVSEHRIDGIVFDVIGFTHLTQDHLDYHGSMEAYFAAKAAMFTPEHASAAVIGIDDTWGQRLAEQCTVPFVTWSAAGAQADWIIEAEGAQCVVRGPGQTYRLRLMLPGEFNRANAVCAFAMLRTVGVEAVDIIDGFADVVVPGRMERFESDGVIAFVDYAHTPDAVARALAAARSTVIAGSAGGGRLIAVLGAGGDRDRGKRAEMGLQASAVADVVVITDDNPRSEDPAVIREAIRAGAEQGTSTVHVIAGRREAIEHAWGLARPGDVIALLGKGHESGQDVGGVVTEFDDRAVLQEVMAR